METDDSVRIDVGNLLIDDQNPLDLKRIRKEKECLFKEIAVTGVNMLLNKLNEIPKELVDYVYITKMPVGTTFLPREKPIPKVKAPTRWEAYAKLKGIRKQKRSHLIFDEGHEEFRPRFGYKKANNEKEKNWMLEVGQDADPFTNPFDKKAEDKKERIARNEYQRLGNIAREVKTQTGGSKVPVAEEKKKFDKEIRNARFATASRGRYLNDGPNEKPHQKKNLKKRKFDPEGDFVNEKKRYLDVLERIKNKTPVVNMQKAASKEVGREVVEKSQEGKKKTKLNQVGKKMDKRRKNTVKGKGGKGKGKR